MPMSLPRTPVPVLPLSFSFVGLYVNIHRQIRIEHCFPFDQETHQNLADRMGLHVVETSKLRADLPVVVASPSDGIVRDQQLIDEEEDLEMDYDRLYFGGKVEYKRPKKLPVYAKLRSYRYKKAENYMRRNQASCKTLRDAGLW